MGIDPYGSVERLNGLIGIFCHIGSPLRQGSFRYAGIISGKVHRFSLGYYPLIIKVIFPKFIVYYSPSVGKRFLVKPHKLLGFCTVILGIVPYF